MWLQAQCVPEDRVFSREVPSVSSHRRGGGVTGGERWEVKDKLKTHGDLFGVR